MAASKPGRLTGDCADLGSAAVLQTNGAVRAIVRKKAALCLLRLLRKAGPEADILQADTWSVKMVCLSLQLHVTPLPNLTSRGSHH